MVIPLLLVIGGALAEALAASHPNSISSSRITIEGARVRHELVLQQAALLEVLPAADTDGSGRIEAAELAAVRDEVADYVARNYALGAGEEGADELQRTFEAIELVASPLSDSPSAPEWVRLDSRCAASEPLEVLTVAMTLFFHTSPDHRDFCEIYWDGELAFLNTFSAFEPRAVFRAEDAPFTPWLSWLRLGLERFLLAPMRVAFVVVLLLGALRPRAAALLALGFLFSAALGYALGVAGLVVLPVRFVGLTVALSSAFAGAQLIARKEVRPLYVEALAFGAIHGQALAEEARLATTRLLDARLPLTAIGLGFGAGVLGLAALGALLVALDARRRARSERAAQRLGALRVLFAAVLAGLGLYGFCLRAGWI